jgi:dTDP-4-dehydrorhamnose reductase
LQKVQPDAIFHLAAQANANACEQNPTAAWAINVEATASLANYAADRSIPFLYTSTDMVFDGKKAPYAPDAPTEPINTYGRQKVEAERLVLAAYPQATIARLPLMYGVFSQEGNFLAQWHGQLLANQPIKAFTDEFRTCVFGGDAALGLWLLLHQGVSGIWHLGGQERLSRYEFAKMLAEVIGADPQLVQAIRQAELPMAANRPADVSLESSSAFALGYAPLGLKAGLEEAQYIF